MDPYDSPLRVPYGSPYNPFPHSLLRTRQKNMLFLGLLGSLTEGVSMIWKFPEKSGYLVLGPL